MGICEVEKSYLGGASFAIALTGSILAPSGNVNLISNADKSVDLERFALHGGNHDQRHCQNLRCRRQHGIPCHK